jgi:hypothetical protein
MIALLFTKNHFAQLAQISSRNDPTLSLVLIFVQHSKPEQPEYILRGIETASGD